VRTAANPRQAHRNRRLPDAGAVAGELAPRQRQAQAELQYWAAGLARLARRLYGSADPVARGDYMTRNMLVTGSGGFIDSAAWRHLVSEGR
jgi:hypothetical protein